jgi:hypothetical protein
MYNPMGGRMPNAIQSSPFPALASAVPSNQLN